MYTCHRLWAGVGMPALLLALLQLWPMPLRAANSCVVLQYHHVDALTPASTSISPRQFEQHLRLIERLDMQVMSLRRVVSSLRRHQPLPERCVAISFDDAYESVHRNAWPLLHQRGWPFTVFVPVESIDRRRSPYMNWAQLRELASAGAEIENHGYSHDHLIRQHPGEYREAWLQRVKEDIERAQQRIRQQIGQRPRLLAWPYGEYLPRFGRLLEELRLTGFGQQSGPASATDDPVALPRFPLSGRYADLEGLRVKLLTLPLPLLEATPRSPLVAIGNRRPELTLTFSPALPVRRLHRGLNCFTDGRNEVSLQWLSERRVRTAPRFDLRPGRHRSNCTLPSGQAGRFHWYSHPWFIREADGSWYPE